MREPQTRSLSDVEILCRAQLQKPVNMTCKPQAWQARVRMEASCKDLSPQFNSSTASKDSSLYTGADRTLGRYAMREALEVIEKLSSETYCTLGGSPRGDGGLLAAMEVQTRSGTFHWAAQSSRFRHKTCTYSSYSCPQDSTSRRGCPCQRAIPVYARRNDACQRDHACARKRKDAVVLQMLGRELRQ